MSKCITILPNQRFDVFDVEANKNLLQCKLWICLISKSVWVPLSLSLSLLISHSFFKVSDVYTLTVCYYLVCSGIWKPLIWRYDRSKSRSILTIMFYTYFKITHDAIHSKSSIQDVAVLLWDVARLPLDINSSPTNLSNYYVCEHW